MTEPHLGLCSLQLGLHDRLPSFRVMVLQVLIHPLGAGLSPGHLGLAPPADGVRGLLGFGLVLLEVGVLVVVVPDRDLFFILINLDDLRSSGR